MTNLLNRGLACRKAKVDLYYSSHASVDAIADYEENLHANLSALMVKLQRDLLRVEGGITDYCVIGEIDVQALRQFQSSHRSSADPFKPVLDGFEIDFDPKALPLEEKL